MKFNQIVHQWKQEAGFLKDSLLNLKTDINLQYDGRVPTLEEFYNFSQLGKDLNVLFGVESPARTLSITGISLLVLFMCFVSCILCGCLCNCPRTGVCRYICFFSRFIEKKIAKRAGYEIPANQQGLDPNTTQQASSTIPPSTSEAVMPSIGQYA